MREEDAFSEVWAHMRGGRGWTDEVGTKGVRGGSFGTDDSSNPVGVAADLSVDSRVLGSSTTWVNAPREDAMQGVVTHQGSTGVTLGMGGDTMK